MNEDHHRGNGRMLALLLAAAMGCPGTTPHRSGGGTVLPATKTPPEAETRPALGEPPFAVVLRGTSGAAAELVGAVSAVLARTAVFSVESAVRDMSGSTVIQIAVRPEGGEQHATARLFAPARGPKRPWAEVAVRGTRSRRLALKLADAIHRKLIDEPSPALSRITFVAGAAAGGGKKQIFVVDFDGQGVRRVSVDDGLSILPAWSPRGDLVYTSFASGHPELVLLPAGDGPPTRLPTHGGLNMGASFSPDGSMIAVTLSRESNTDIYLLQRDGSLLRRLTRDPAIDISPTWSPDGSRIAFVSDRSGSPQVWVIPAGGGAARRLTVAGSYNQEPNWCSRPGSAQIAYTRRHKGERYEIHVVDADSGESVQRTSDGGVNKSPRWSPSCRQLVYSGEDGLWVIAAKGAQRFQLYRGKAETPAWSAPR